MSVQIYKETWFEIKAKVVYAEAETRRVVLFDEWRAFHDNYSNNVFEIKKWSDVRPRSARGGVSPS